MYSPQGVIMTKRDAIISIFQSSESSEKINHRVFMPDLTTWYDWHAGNGSLPDEMKEKSLEDVCRILNVPVWNKCKPLDC